MNQPTPSTSSSRNASLFVSRRMALITSTFGLGLSSAFATPTLVEAEDMTISNFVVRNSAFSSGQRHVRVHGNGNAGTLSFVYNGESTVANIAVTYYDESDGNASYSIYRNGRKVGGWTANQATGVTWVTLDSRRVANIPNITINNGDTISLATRRYSNELPGIDCIEIEPTIEAEAMSSSGYSLRSFPTASGGQCLEPTSTTGTATTRFTGEEGYYSITTGYYDENDGEATYVVKVDNKTVDYWTADKDLGHRGPIAITLTERISDWVYLENNSVITVSSTKNVRDEARLDRIVIGPASNHIETLQASRFLSQASFGGNRNEIHNLARRINQIGHIPACEEWIDEQMALPRGNTIMDDARYHQAYTGTPLNQSQNIQNFEIAWWHQAIESEEQLRNRMAFALSQIFVTSSTHWGNLETWGLWETYVNYYDKLRDHAFQSHRDLLGTITYDPFMGVYLTFANNSKGIPNLDVFPDENYAREIMQLFSCGLYSLKNDGDFNTSRGNLIENYDNDDIKEFAEVFTGLALVQNASGRYGNFLFPVTHRGFMYEYPMVAVDQFHDTSSKVLLNGVVLPANQGTNADISQALDNLSSHPSTAPYIGRELIKRFTTSNPSSDYVSRVTQAWLGSGPYGNGARGEFASVLKAILLDPEARDALSIAGTHNANNLSSDNVTVSSNDELSGRLQEPILKWTRLFNYLDAASNHEESLLTFPVKVKYSTADTTPEFGQVPMRAKSVFNYYDTNYSPGNGPIQTAKDAYGYDIVTPETEILSDHVIRDFEECLDIMTEGVTRNILVLTDENGRRTTSVHQARMELLRNAIAERYPLDIFLKNVNRDLCNGQIDPETLDIIFSRADASSSNGSDSTRESSRIQAYANAMSIIFASADYSITN